MIQDIDILVFKWIHHELKNSFFDILLPICRNKLVWIPLYFYLIYYLKSKFENSYFRILILTISSVIISDLLCAQVLKPFVERIRPCQIYLVESWFHNFNLCSKTYSFPSCHAMNHAVILFSIFPFVTKWLRVSLIFWVFLIGFSQVYVGVHFPSDILGGIFIGFFISKIIQKLFLRFILLPPEG